MTLECRVRHPFRTDKAASINAEKLHAVFICYELCQKSRQAVADIENAMKIIIAEQASCDTAKRYRRMPVLLSVSRNSRVLNGAF